MFDDFSLVDHEFDVFCGLPPFPFRCHEQPSKGLKRTMKTGLGFSGFSRVGWGLEAVQCAPQQQLLVVELCWEEEFTK